MEAVILNQKWENVWKVELNESIFGIDINENLIHRALIYQRANARINIAFTRTRWERRGSTRKIYRQKWTGRARMGSNRSPIRKKGWVVFGPRWNRSFEISMNKKERKKALYSVLSSKVLNKELIIVDDIKLKETKTKLASAVFSKLKFEKNVLFVIPEKNEVLEKSTSNLPEIKTILVDYLNIVDLLKYKTLVFLKPSLEKVNSLTK